ATPDEPVLGLLLDLNTPAMAEALVAYEAAARPRRTTATDELMPGLVVAEVDDGFAEAVERLLELLDDPVALRVLAAGRLRELLFAIIEGKAGPLVRQTLGAAHDITRVLDHVRANLGEPLSVDDLARRAGMSRAVFHRRFKAATTFSPLQFIKALRLSHAAMQIMGGKAVNRAADAVGYTSASQFSREFRRQFGASPREWARTAASSPPDVQAVSA
ncbi:MAG: AraC family transcriptional regulator, partial [Longimicrobiales bacterium]